MILGFVGRRGSGKTLSMIKQAKGDYDKGRVIYSNIKLTVPHILLSKELLTEFMSGSKELRNCTVILDEAHMYMDSRMSPSKRNLLISYFLLQTRKLDVDVYYTTQTIDQVDKRMRAQTDILIFCTSAKMIFDGLELVYIKNLIYDVHSKQHREIYFLGNDFYYLYDTYEIVPI